MDAMDGEVARVKHLDSPAGYVADGLCDRLRDTAVIAGLGIGAARDGIDVALAWTLAAVIGYLLFFYVSAATPSHWREIRAAADLDEKHAVRLTSGVRLGAGDTLAMGVLIAAAIDRPLWLVAAIAVLAPFAIAAKVRRLFAQRPWERESAGGSRMSATRGRNGRSAGRPDRTSTRRARVAFVGVDPDARGGIAQFGANLVRSVEDSADTLIVSYRQLYPRFTRPGRQGPDPTPQSSGLDGMPIIVPWDRSTWRRGGRALERFGPDLVVLQWWSPLFAGCACGSSPVACAVRGARVVIVCHNDRAHEGFPFGHSLTRAALAEADVLLTLSSAVTERLRRLVPECRRAHPAPPAEHACDRTAKRASRHCAAAAASSRARWSCSSATCASTRGSVT